MQKPSAMPFIAVFVTLATSACLAVTLIVAPNGNDANPGTRSQPLASLDAARDAARKAGAGPHVITVMPGEYFLATPLELDARDSGLTLEGDPSGKAILYGGVTVTGWRRDGDTLWCADLPGVREGSWDFRTLVVNGLMPERARMPAKETFNHQSVFDVRWLCSVGGGWDRKPTEEELTTLRYDPKDIPATLEVRNAEVRVYHMWDDSLVGVASNDAQRQTLLFSTKTGHPAGAFGVKKYVVFNTREGMTRPGQWYLDRTVGKVVYWPLPDEDMTRAHVVAPKLERLITIKGSAKAPVERLTVRNLVLQATTTPLKPGGFSAGNYDAAITLVNARACAFDGLEICNVGGQAIKSWELDGCRFTRCHIYRIGACGIRAEGSDSSISSNLSHHVGICQPSAVAIQLGHSYSETRPKGFHIFRNEIHDTPYSGIIASGGAHLIEENLISRVMRELHDGAAIYSGGLNHSTLRGNMVRDVVKIGDGYGASAYYLDEGSEACVIERNVAVGVEMPTHNHIAKNVVLRDNFFFSDGDMTLSFARSRDCAMIGNTLFARGKITVSPPNAVTVWTSNVLFRGDAAKSNAPTVFAITDVMPAAPPPARRTWPFAVTRTAKPPALDGEIAAEEWPGALQAVDRLPSRWSASGAPVFAEFAYDDQCLYVALNVVLFDITKLDKSHVWGQADGVELCVAGNAGTFVLRGFSDGTFRSVTDAGVSAEAARRLEAAVRFAAKPYGEKPNDWKSGWRCEWAIPFEALGLKPSAGLIFAFNLGIYRAEDQLWRCLEGTFSENWRLKKGSTLQLLKDQ